MKFAHIGVPVATPAAGSVHNKEGKMYLTDPADSPFHFEYITFEAGCTMPEPIQKNVHVAFAVDKIEDHLVGVNIIIPPFEKDAHTRLAFIEKDGMILELMQHC